MNDYIRIQLRLTPEEFEKLWNQSAKYFLRENPRKTWSLKEQKQAIVEYIKKKAA